MSATKSEIAKQNPIEVPLYTLWDTARYLHLPVWSVLALSDRVRPNPKWFFHNAWKRWHHFDPDDDTGFPFREDFPRLSFHQFADLFVRAFVVEAAWDRGRAKEWNKDYWFHFHETLWLLLEHSFEMGMAFERDVVNVANRLVDLYAKRLPEVDTEWLRKLVQRRVERVEVQNGAPVRLFPFSRDPVETSPRLIVLDPQIRFGRPVLVGHGVPTDMLLERFHAGDSTQELAADYDVTLAEVDEAIRYETLPTAPLYPPVF